MPNNFQVITIYITRPCFSPDRNNLNNLGRLSRKKHLCQCFVSSRASIFNVAKEISMWSNYLKNFQRGPAQEITCEIISKFVDWLRRKSEWMEGRMVSDRNSPPYTSCSDQNIIVQDSGPKLAFPLSGSFYTKY